MMRFHDEITLLRGMQWTPATAMSVKEMHYVACNPAEAWCVCVCVQGQGKRKLLHVPKYDKWDNVFLEYRVDWPLHLLLTPQVTFCSCSTS